MASALVSYDRGGVAEGIIKFCHDKDVETVLLASKGDRQLSRLRLSNSITDDCLRNSSLDVMVWMDGQTRNVSSSPFILKFQGAVPAPIKLATWDKPSKTSQVNSSIEDEVSSKMKASKISPEEKSPKKNSIPHEPSYPRPPADLYKPYEEPPLALINESNITAPISDLSATKRQRRKSSLKYYIHDQIAKGKKTLTTKDTDDTMDGSWNGVYLEPLSP